MQIVSSLDLEFAVNTLPPADFNNCIISDFEIFSKFYLHGTKKFLFNSYFLFCKSEASAESLKQKLYFYSILKSHSNMNLDASNILFSLRQDSNHKIFIIGIPKFKAYNSLNLLQNLFITR